MIHKKIYYLLSTVVQYIFSFTCQVLLFFELDIAYWVFSLVDIIVIAFHFRFIDSFSSSLQHECSDGDNVFLKHKHIESKHALRTPIMYCLYRCLESSK